MNLYQELLTFKSVHPKTKGKYPTESEFTTCLKAKRVDCQWDDEGIGIITEIRIFNEASECLYTFIR